MIGKWNKSVILSYVGLFFSVLGIFLLYQNIDVKYAIVCLVIAGVCDMFDGTIARMCKRTEEEKNFGIELDALIDVLNFVALPIVIFCSLGLTKIYHYPIYGLYATFAVARLAHFNTTLEDNNKPVKYYEGLPVTFSALIFPCVYLLSFVLTKNIFQIVYTLTILIVSILFICKIKMPKPKLKASILLLLLAIIISILYLFVL